MKIKIEITANNIVLTGLQLLFRIVLYCFLIQIIFGSSLLINGVSEYLIQTLSSFLLAPASLYITHQVDKKKKNQKN